MCDSTHLPSQHSGERGFQSSEFQVSLFYTASSRPSRTVQWVKDKTQVMPLRRIGRCFWKNRRSTADETTDILQWKQEKVGKREKKERQRKMQRTITGLHLRFTYGWGSTSFCKLWKIPLNLSGNLSLSWLSTVLEVPCLMNLSKRQNQFPLSVPKTLLTPSRPALQGGYTWAPLSAKELPLLQSLEDCRSNCVGQSNSANTHTYTHIKR